MGVIPGRRGGAEANPESSDHRAGVLDSGFSTLGLRPRSRPGMTDMNVGTRTLGLARHRWLRPRDAPALERGPDAAFQPESVERCRRLDGADAVETDAG